MVFTTYLIHTSHRQSSRLYQAIFCNHCNFTYLNFEEYVTMLCCTPQIE